MVQSMKATGKMIKQMEKGDLFMLTEMYMKEIGLMIRRMAMVLICMLMGQNMLENGVMTNSMALVRKTGWMGAALKGITRMEKNMEKENLNGLTNQFTMVNFFKIIFKVI